MLFVLLFVLSVVWTQVSIWCWKEDSINNKNQEVVSESITYRHLLYLPLWFIIIAIIIVVNNRGYFWNVLQISLQSYYDWLIDR